MATMSTKSFMKVYKLKKEIGVGEFWKLYKIQVRISKEIRTAKKMDKTMYSSENAGKEIRLLNLCHHVNVIKLLDHVEDNVYSYLIFEQVNKTLVNELKEKRSGRFDVLEGMEVLVQVSKGLNHLHSIGIYHRNLCPSNIGVNEKMYKILDMSSATDCSGWCEEEVGTADYTAIEIQNERPYKAASADVFSFGVISYEILVGSTPFIYADTISIMKGVFDRPDFVDASLMNLIQTELYFCPRERPTAGKIAKDLIKLQRNIEKKHGNPAAPSLNVRRSERQIPKTPKIQIFTRPVTRPKVPKNGYAKLVVYFRELGYPIDKEILKKMTRTEMNKVKGIIDRDIGKGRVINDVDYPIYIQGCVKAMRTAEDKRKRKEKRKRQ